MKKKKEMTVLPVNTAGGAYEVAVCRGGLYRLGEIWELDRQVMIVTDSGVPSEYAKAARAQCKNAFIVTLPEGEATKSTDSLILLWEKMAQAKMTRADAVMAVGGGVVGDLCGFAAATYMRGIDFYNVPTTVLSQVDSSVGGKTAVDFKGYKNIVGAFWQPRGVMLDADTLATLPDRQVANGLAEAVKMAVTFDSNLFSFIEAAVLRGETAQVLEEIIKGAVSIKIKVVEQDEREAGLRKVLNFGHTLAHALESRCSFEELYHGECVALGMLPMCEPSVRERLSAVLEAAGLPTRFPCDIRTLAEAASHDKKMTGKGISCITCSRIGEYEIRTVSAEKLCELAEEGGIL